MIKININFHMQVKIKASELKFIQGLIDILKIYFI